MSKIQKICVIGAGVMGAGIAAQIANSKTSVVLLDIIPGAAVSAKDKMLSGKVPQIAHPMLLEYVTAGNLDESLDIIKTCDWVIEVIIEKLDVKAALYKKIQPFMKKGAILSSNTSTLPLASLRSSVDHTFLLTHFFNPPRQMQLLEMIYDNSTPTDAIENLSQFITLRLGKTIVKSNDTPGFIANRIGCFLLELCLKEAYEKKLSIEYIDNYFTKECGLPSTGIFGLFDLIGLDVMQMISEVLVTGLSKEDAFCKTYQKYDWYQKMLNDGYKGRKGLGGFYRMREEAGKKIKEVLDFKAMEYVASLRGIEDDAAIARDKGEMQSILDQFFAYVKSLLGVVSSSKEDIDTAIKLGYSWKKGPFEMMEGASLSSAPRDDDVGLIARNDADASAFLHSPKPGVLIFSFNTKMNTFDEDVFNLLIESIDYAEQHRAERLIIYTEGKHFSAGANLKLFLEMSEKSEIKKAEKFLELGQRAMMRVKYSKVPVVACAKGVALGGGCELLLHSHKVVAHLDLSAGLVEVGVGLIPGWGGVKEMVMRADGDNTKLVKNLRNIIMQNKSSSAYWFASDYVAENVEVVMNENELLEVALNIPVSSHKLPNNNEFSYNIDLISSSSDLKLDNHTLFILKALQDEINSARVSEAKILEIERRIFLKLLVMPSTGDKIRAVI